MMRRRRAPGLRRFALLGLAFAAGCAATAPTRFYLLGAVAPETPVAAATAASARTIAVGPVSVADYLDRPQMVLRENENRVRIAEGDRWAAPLADLVADALAADLAARLPGDRVLGFPAAGATGFDLRVVVDVTRLEVGPAREAVVAARWRIHGPAGGPPLLGGEATERSAAAGDTGEDRAAALSRATAALSDAIAHSLAALPRAEATGLR